MTLAIAISLLSIFISGMAIGLMIRTDRRIRSRLEERDD
jgi:hypothetical protein